MSDLVDLPSLLQQFFRSALLAREPARETEAAKAIAAAVETGPAWMSSLGQTVDWLKTDPALWARATDLAAIYLDPRLGTGSAEPLPSRLLLRELVQASPSDAGTFVAAIQDEQALHRLAPILPDLILETDAVLTLLACCASFRSDGESPAAARELTEWATRCSTQAKDIVEHRIASRDNGAAFHVWAVEPLVEGVMRSEAITVEERMAWRDATISALLASPSPRRQSLAAYLSCVAWPEPKPPAAQRHAALLAIASRAPAELLPSALDAVMRDVWTNQEATFETLVKIAELVEEGELSFERMVSCLRKVADVASRGLSTLEGALFPDALRRLLPHLHAIPPTASARDHALDFLLDGIFKRDRGALESFLLAYVRAHAAGFLHLGLSFSEAFPLLTQNVGAGLLGSWLVGWMVDVSDSLRTCGAQWAGTIENVRPNRTSLAELTPTQAHAFVHVALIAPVRGEAVFALVNAIAETRDDVYELVRSAFLDELSLDYPGLTRRWVEQIQSKGDASKASLANLAVELRERQVERDRIRVAHEGAPELYATSPCYGAWMDLHQQILAAQTREAEKSSILAQIVSKVHVARGESMSHSLSREPLPFIYQDFSYEERLRAMLDPIGLQQVRIAHFTAARRLLSLEVAK
jgi:hypothetical protein